jgi:collagenase-like PrtC family protease
MIEIIATAESVNQAKKLVDIGIDTLYIGQDEFGLRLPASFTKEEVEEITKYTHEHNKKVYVAVNAIMHNERIPLIVPYLQFLEQIGVDAITLGDPGVYHLLKKNEISLPFIYDAHVLVTSARQINFWVKRGAIGAVLARELTFPELKEIRKQVTVPIEVQVYGATCIHQSKRPLVENYFRFTKETDKYEKGKNLYISEPKHPDTHYSIYEDINGTHIFATNDLNLMPYLDQLYEVGLTTWKLDGLFTKGENFVEIAKLFVQAKTALSEGNFYEIKNRLDEQIKALHPQERGLDEGFLLKDPTTIK